MTTATHDQVAAAIARTRQVHPCLGMLKQGQTADGRLTLFCTACNREVYRDVRPE
jgi:hypothetical protein